MKKVYLMLLVLLAGFTTIANAASKETKMVTDKTNHETLSVQQVHRRYHHRHHRYYHHPHKTVVVVHP